MIQATASPQIECVQGRRKRFWKLSQSDTSKQRESCQSFWQYLGKLNEIKAFADVKCGEHGGKLRRQMLEACASLEVECFQFRREAFWKMRKACASLEVECFQFRREAFWKMRKACAVG